MSKLFTPIKFRGQTLKNRIFVAPMCQYSAMNSDGKPTDWHMVHLGSRAVGGAGLVMFEATAVTPEGRITPGCLGIWSDEHIEYFSRIADFISAQGSTPAIQLAHAGRKASHEAPWLGGKALDIHQGGWKIKGPSPIAYSSENPVPQELSHDEIQEVINSFVEAAIRSLKAKIKIIELHFAHGYLVCSFLSPLSNKRTDKYGGSFNNRIRLPIEIVDAVRNSIPEKTPLFARISSTEYADHGWNLEDSISFSKELKKRGVDLIDCSSGGNFDQQEMESFPGYQVSFASKIRTDAEIMTGAVGLITDPDQAEAILRNGQADVIFLARELLRNPYWPMYAEQFLEGTSSSFKDQYSAAVPFNES